MTGLLHASAARAHTNDFETLLGDIGAKQAESAATGVGLALWKDGRIVHVGGVGARDRSFSHPVDADTHFRIGSISKMLVAIAVMQQVEAGRLRLQQPVSELAPELPIDNPWDATDPVRLVHLLEHSAGFDDMHFSHFHARPEDQTLKDVLRRLQPELQVRWRPGSRFAYNNPGYGVAAYLVEKSSGMDYRAYVTERILQPLGMLQTVWQAEQAAATLAQGYADDRSAEPFEDLAIYPAGGLISTPADMARLLRWYASAGQDGPALLSTAAFARLEQSESTPAGVAGLAQGYGLGNTGRERKGIALNGHDGGIAGYRSTLSYSREDGLGYVILTNAFDGSLLAEIATLLLDRLGPGERPVPTYAPAEAGLESRSGWYQLAAPRNQILAGVERLFNAAEVRIDGEQMHFKHPLLPISYDYRIVNGRQLLVAGTRTPIGVLTDEGETPVIAHRLGYWQKGNWFNVALPAYAIFAAFVLLASSLLYAIVWVPIWLWRRRDPARTKRLHLWPLMATGALLTTGLTVARMPASAVTSVNVHTLGICVGTIAFALIACAGLVACWRQRGHLRGRWQALEYGYAVLLCLAATGLSLWLWHTGLLGLRTWAW
ncbi:MAG: beta-lactamase family protein [Rhodanobacteraceae bacterium]|nr:beta-lactamase family protein [Rhodanobacteraceae bacterium]